MEGNSDCVPECLDGSAYHFAQCVFELGEDLLDGIEVWAVSWQEAHYCTRGFDGFPNAGAFMGSEIVHQYDFAGRQGRDEHLLDIGKEPRAVINFLAAEAQFTSTDVESKSQHQRDKMIVRARVLIDPARLGVAAAGLRVPAYVRLDPQIAWPPQLLGHAAK